MSATEMLSEQAEFAGQVNPDRFLNMAKKAALDNYNMHRNKKHVPELRWDEVYIVSFNKTDVHWSALLASTVAHGLLWVVSCDDTKNIVTLVVYTRRNQVRIPTRKLK